MGLVWVRVCLREFVCLRGRGVARRVGFPPPFPGALRGAVGGGWWRAGGCGFLRRDCGGLAWLIVR